MGTSHSDECNKLAKTIWEWCICNSIWISLAHILGKQNFIADFESRRNQRESEWMLNNSLLSVALESLEFAPEIDLFASRIYTQFHIYVSYRPDPNAFAIDAFTLNWGLSSFQFNSSGFIKDAERGRGGDLCATGLVNSKLARPGISNDEKTTGTSQSKPRLTQTAELSKGTTSNVDKNESVCVPLIRKSLERYDLSSSAQETLMASWISGTSKQYRRKSYSIARKITWIYLTRI